MERFFRIFWQLVCLVAKIASVLRALKWLRDMIYS